MINKKSMESHDFLCQEGSQHKKVLVRKERKIMQNFIKENNINKIVIRL